MDKIYVWPLLSFIITLFFVSDVALADDIDLSSELSFTNRYQFRGLIQSEDSPAVQGAIDVRWSNDIYLGTWGSWVLEGEQGDVELNYYLGGLLELNGILWNAGYIYYDYRDPPGNDFRQEVFLIGYWQNIRASIYQDLDGTPDTYTELYTRWKGPLKGDIFFSAGQQSFQADTFLTYKTYVLGWERLWRDQWSFSLYYTDTSDLIRNPSNISATFKWYLQPGRRNRTWQK